MQKSKLARKGRKGFTLVEVALAVAVGLIIIGGAVLGYNAVKDNASNSNARNKVLAAVGTVEEFAASNNGMYPTGAQFRTMWGTKRTDDATLNPWGGQVGANGLAVGANGVTIQAVGQEVAGAFATEDLAEAGAADDTSDFAPVSTPGNAGTLLYSSVNSAAGPWAALTNGTTGTTVGVRGFVVGIYSKDGSTPWWDVKGGK